MTPRTLTIRGEAFLTLETVAECYCVEVHWLEEVYDLGLLGSGETVEGSTAIEASMLDRVGTILRLHRQLGVDIAGMALVLDEFERRATR